MPEHAKRPEKVHYYGDLRGTPKRFACGREPVIGSKWSCFAWHVNCKNCLSVRRKNGSDGLHL